MFQRLLQGLVTILVASVVIFSLVHLVPGDPAQIMLGERATPQAIERIREELKLDDPLPLQFARFWKDLLSGDLGYSFRSGTSVLDEIKARFPATIELTFSAMALAILFGVLFGALAASKPGGFFDLCLSVGSVVGVSIPIFFLGILFILLFAVVLDWFPISGRPFGYHPTTGFIFIDSLIEGNFELFGEAARHQFLPAVTLSTVPMSLIARLTRSSLMEALKHPSIRTARAKGVSEFQIFMRHAFRNSLVPVVTMIGLQMSLLLGGAILTETVFAWPGIGRWMVLSVEGRDFSAVRGAMMMFVMLIVTISILTDFLCRWIDPRMRVRQ